MSSSHIDAECEAEHSTPNDFELELHRRYTELGLDLERFEEELAAWKKQKQESYRCNGLMMMRMVNEKAKLVSRMESLASLSSSLSSSSSSSSFGVTPPSSEDSPPPPTPYLLRVELPGGTIEEQLIFRDEPWVRKRLVYQSHVASNTSSGALEAKANGGAKKRIHVTESHCTTKKRPMQFYVLISLWIAFLVVIRFCPELWNNLKRVLEEEQNELPTSRVGYDVERI